MKIVTILGARPQFIKASSVSREINRKKKKGVDINEVIIHTGQHYDVNMSDVFFKEMEIPKPDYLLGIGGKKHGAMLGQMIERIEEVLVKEKPDWVVVYGDTNSTLAGAISADKLNIKIAHIESGLRSFNMEMPEESNRILTDRISSVLFCPTAAAVKNLENEGIHKWQTDATLVLSGDVMQDGVIFYKDLAKKIPDLEVMKDFVLCTIHRAENTDNTTRLASIVSTLNEIAKERQVIFSLHPRTKSILLQGNYDVSNLTIINPVGYLNMVWLINNCSLIITDSGGLQKESFFFEKPCITVRDETEWVELVENDFNVVVSANKQKIINAYSNFNFQTNYDINLYGSGMASQIIIENLIALN